MLTAVPVSSIEHKIPFSMEVAWMDGMGWDGGAEEDGNESLGFSESIEGTEEACSCCLFVGQKHQLMQRRETRQNRVSQRTKELLCGCTPSTCTNPHSEGRRRRSGGDRTRGSRWTSFCSRSRRGSADAREVLLLSSNTPHTQTAGGD